MLERLGGNIRGIDMRTQNVAAVSVVANISSFARQGSRIDVQVAALGDAPNLHGGPLLATPLIALNGEVYRSEERRVGKAFASTCRSRWSSTPSNKHKARHQQNIIPP